MAPTDAASDWQSKALDIALDERAREIDLYWKRTAYSWTLNAAAFAGYFALANSKSGDARFDLLAVIACLGIACSYSWYAINRGSKYWQENWEVQVDLLETEIAGPLHRINPEQDSYYFWRLNQAYPFSVSKVNQLLSLFISSIWVGLLIDAGLHLAWSIREGSPFVSIVVLGTAGFCVCLSSVGRTTPHVNVIGKTVWLKKAPIDDSPPAV